MRAGAFQWPHPLFTGRSEVRISGSGDCGASEAAVGLVQCHEWPLGGFGGGGKSLVFAPGFHPFTVVEAYHYVPVAIFNKNFDDFQQIMTKQYSFSFLNIIFESSDRAALVTWGKLMSRGCPVSAPPSFWRLELGGKRSKGLLSKWPFGSQSISPRGWGGSPSWRTRASTLLCQPLAKLFLLTTAMATYL